MNKERRARLQEAWKLLNEMESFREQAESIIREVADDEQAAFENLTEGLQATERGQAMEEAASNLSEIADNLDPGVMDITSMLQGIEEAQG